MDCQVLEAWGTEFAVITAESGKRGVDWAQVRARLHQHADFLLLPEDLPIPEEHGFVQPSFPRFQREVLLHTCCALIEQSRIPMYRRVLGLVDPDAQYPDLLDTLLKHYTTVQVVTQRTARYELEAERMMERYGAPVLVGDSPGILRECALVLAPQGLTLPEDLRLNCPVLGEEPRPGRHTDLFSDLQVVPSGPEAARIPPGISPHLFAGALYEHCGVSVGELVAGRMLYNLKRATLSEAVYATLRSAGYPAGL